MPDLEAQALPGDVNDTCIATLAQGLERKGRFYTRVKEPSSGISIFFLFKILSSLRKICVCACLVAQLRPTLCHLMGSSLPSSAVHGILQLRTLEWVAIPFSRGSPQPRD